MRLCRPLINDCRNCHRRASRASLRTRNTLATFDRVRKDDVILVQCPIISDGMHSYDCRRLGELWQDSYKISQSLSVLELIFSRVLSFIFSTRQMWKIIMALCWLPTVWLWPCAENNLGVQMERNGSAASCVKCESPKLTNIELFNKYIVADLTTMAPSNIINPQRQQSR